MFLVFACQSPKDVLCSYIIVITIIINIIS